MDSLQIGMVFHMGLYGLGYVNGHDYSIMASNASLMKPIMPLRGIMVNKTGITQP